MAQKEIKGIALGAFVGAILGTAGAIFFPPKLNQQSFSNEEEPLNRAGEMHPEKFIAGAFSGVLLGAISALLLAPKSGRQLRKELTSRYHTVTDRAHYLVDYWNKKSAIKVRPAAKTIKEDAKSLVKKKKPRRALSK